MRTDIPLARRSRGGRSGFQESQENWENQEKRDKKQEKTALGHPSRGRPKARTLSFSATPRTEPYSPDGDLPSSYNRMRRSI